MTRLDRAMFGFATLPTGLAVLFLLRPPFLTDLWPFPGTTDLSFVFVAAILAAAAAAMVWASVVGETASYVGIALDVLVTFVPLTLFLVLHDPARGGGLSVVLAACFVMALTGMLLLRAAWGQPVADPRPVPRLVRVAFVVFAVSLLSVAAQLISGAPYVFPWPLTRELAMVGGLVFLGSSIYFGYGVIRPSWSNAGGQLAAFLAYDLVLILPLLVRLADTGGTFRTSLMAYVAVLLVSGVIAIWYLFLDPRTRMRSPHSRPTPADPGRA